MNPHAFNNMNDNSDAEPIPWTENCDAVIVKKFGDNNISDADEI